MHKKITEILKEAILADIISEEEAHALLSAVKIAYGRYTINDTTRYGAVVMDYIGDWALDQYTGDDHA